MGIDSVLQDMCGPSRYSVEVVHARDGLLEHLEAWNDLARNAAERGMTVQEWLSSMVPAGRFQSPDETAAVITFLCGDGSSFTSGQAISVAGGALG